METRGREDWADLDDDDQYTMFVDKFKPKKTTDDCYTPQNVYEAILGWAVNEYGLQGREIMRPFKPGGNYKAEEYKPGCVVIDNPPFSILSEICCWYDARNIYYFLFAPAMSLFSIDAGCTNYVISDSDITYENGANVRTAFVTNLGKYKIHVAPALHKIVKGENDKNTKPAVQLQKYAYPDEVITAATIQKICKYGVSLKIAPEHCAFTRSLDDQKASKKSIFGAGFLLSEKAAAEKAAAEKAGAVIWKLSPREKEIVKHLGGKRKRKGGESDDDR